MTSISTPPAPKIPRRAALFSPRRMLRSMGSWLPARDLMVAALLVLWGAAATHAEEQMQDWLPDVLEMPGDAELVTEREIGSSVRLFTLSTAEDVDPLLEDWEESLRENGYQIYEGESEVPSRSIEFSGPGIANAKIIVTPTRNEGRTLIEFDATLE